MTQHEPIWLDLEGTVAKTIAIIKQAALEGAKLVAFPECWIPGQYHHCIITLTNREACASMILVNRRLHVASSPRLPGLDMVCNQREHDHSGSQAI